MPASRAGWIRVAVGRGPPAARAVMAGAPWRGGRDAARRLP
ncbi:MULTISPECIES: hypothetical protein [Novacetimonas]|nr:hypothetical protein [Novacetimonas hansenii]